MHQIFITLLLVFTVYCKKIDRDDWENSVYSKTVTVTFPVYSITLPTKKSLQLTPRNVPYSVSPEVVPCNSNISKSMTDLRKKIVCTPRDTVVTISDENKLNVSPSTVVIKRCGGMCTSAKKCQSKKSKIVDFYVTTISQAGNTFCSRISLEEDVECFCACPPRKCKPRQFFDQNSCKCTCMDPSAKANCLQNAGENYKWNQRTCSCGCRKDKTCTTGTKWLPDLCKCVVKML